MQVDTDVLIVGAGPAGLQLAYHLDCMGIDHLVLESGHTPGTFFRRYPRHRKLISINKPNIGVGPVEPLRYDWNSLLGSDEDVRFTQYTGNYFPDADRIVDYLVDYADRHQTNVRFGVQVNSIERAPNSAGFLVRTSTGRAFMAKRIVVATGLSKPYLPNIPGIEKTEFYPDVVVDPRDFQNQRVLIIGKGNSAFETADRIIEAAATIHLCSPNPVRFAWKSHYVGHVRAVNNNFLDTYLLKSQNAVLDAAIERIKPLDNCFQADIVYTHASEHRASYTYDRVITCAGFRIDDSIFPSELDVKLCDDGKFPLMTSKYEAVNTPGLYFAGTLMQARDYRKTMSGFIHGFRYNVRALASILAHSDKQLPPDETIDADPPKLAKITLRRLNMSDAIFLQPGYICDALVSDGNGYIHFHEGVPLDFVRDGHLGENLFTVTLEYGPEAEDPFRIERTHNPAYAKRTPFLHPVIRFFRGGVEVNKLDVLEDLENRFSDDYLPELSHFYSGCLSRV